MRYSFFKRRTLLISYVLYLISFCLISCGGDDNNYSKTQTQSQKEATKDNSPYASGKTIYQKTCITCHQADGKGMAGTYPPLAGSDYLLADNYRAIKQVLKGSMNKITVNGTDYQGVMTPQVLCDSDAANVLNYVYHSFGNNGFTVSSIDVKSVRDTLK